MSELSSLKTTAWRRHRAKVKRQYSLQLTIGLPFLLVSLFTYFYVGGLSELLNQANLLRNTQLAEATFITSDEDHYIQTGTGVSFRRWSTEFEFRVGDQLIHGQEIVDYPPYIAKTAIVYFDAANPDRHSLRKPALSLFILNLLAILTPALLALIFLALALSNKRELKVLESELST